MPLPRGHRRVPEDLRVRLHLPTVPGQVRTDPTTKYGTFFSFKQTSTGILYVRVGQTFFSKERNVLAFFCVLFKRMQRSRVLLRSL